jgi:hypothetical protein
VNRGKILGVDYQKSLCTFVDILERMWRGSGSSTIPTIRTPSTGLPTGNMGDPNYNRNYSELSRGGYSRRRRQYSFFRFSIFLLFLIDVKM